MKAKLCHERDLSDEFIWKDDAGLITKYHSHSRQEEFFMEVPSMKCRKSKKISCISFIKSPEIFIQS